MTGVVFAEMIFARRQCRGGPGATEAGAFDWAGVLSWLMAGLR